MDQDQGYIDAVTETDTEKGLPRPWMAGFLTILRQTTNVGRAAAAVGKARPYVYLARSKWPYFRSKWDEAIEAASDDLEERARERAMTDSDTLMIFLLKAHRPQKYREPRMQQNIFVVQGDSPKRISSVEDIQALSDDELQQVMEGEYQHIDDAKQIESLNGADGRVEGAA